MCPILFQFGPFTIYSYGFTLAIAVLISLSLLLQEARRQGFNKDVILDLGIVLLIAGIVGARFLYVVLNSAYFLKNPQEIIMIHHGGLAILGGLFFGVLAVEVFVKKKGLSFLRIADLLVPFVVLAHSIGRIGCFFNGCCYGIPSRFGFYFPVHDAVLLPTQLIASLSLLILFGVLRSIQSRQHKAGVVFAMYVILYSLLRFFIEFIRFDSPRIFFGLTIFQVLCIVSLSFGIIFFAGIKKQK